MKKLIKLKPVFQTGHNCKITAIATVDKYFAHQLGFEPRATVQLLFLGLNSS